MDKVDKVIGIYRVYFRDASGAMRLAIVNDVKEIKSPNQVVKVEKNRPDRCFKCC
jgi:hypothetical protein